MSDAFWVAFWAGFWNNLAGIIVSLASGIVALVSAFYARKSVKVTEVCSTDIARRADTAVATALETKTALIAQVEEVKTVAARSKEEMEFFGAGRERHGVTVGMQIERDRSSSPAPLGK